MNCPKCESERKVKNGTIKGVQKYKCKACNYSYSVMIKSTAKPLSVKRKALQLYLEGLGFRSIGRILDVSNVSVLNWIRSFGEQVKALQKITEEIKIVELDEMHSYIGQKKTTAGSGLLLIELGENSSTSLLVTEAVKPLKNCGIK
jgi:hypothetical protein